ncbi:MAG: MBL fold metallo-hydrolase [Paracoccaceae bacterium]|nr:MBL fold metallo-hydrolase [Paracoccaceae bacterium]
MTLLKPTRRELLKFAAMAPAFTLPALPARAQLGAPASPNPTHFRFSVGDAQMTVISDGYFTTPAADMGVNIAEDEVKAFMEKNFLSPETFYAHTNHLFIEIGDNKVLVDVGSGTRVFDTSGRLLSNLEDAGIDAGDITHVVITHGHPDHLWGIRDDFDEPIFPDAEYIMGETEQGYWLQDGLLETLEGADQQFAVGAINSINADGLEWTLGNDGYEVVPGVRLLATPGHTIGHTSIAIESNGEQLIALGDAMVHSYASFAHPDWNHARDQIPEVAVASRKRIMDMAATDRIAVLGYHFPFPGVGHVIREGEGFRFLPALWQL